MLPPAQSPLSTLGGRSVSAANSLISRAVQSLVKATGGTAGIFVTTKPMRRAPASLLALSVSCPGTVEH